MADEQAPQAEAAPAKGGGSLKAILIVAAVLLIEGGTIVGTIMLSGGPAPVKGEGIAADGQAELNKLVEVLVVKDKFSNERTGRIWYYDTDITATVKSKNVEKFTEELESMKARLTNDIHTIFRRAEPTHFQEPTRATLTRQIQAVLDERFGKDVEDEPYVVEVIINWRRYRGD
jgi:flagellar basal body-associated protein FliL